MFSNFFLKSFRILLFPFALVYWAIIAIRNYCYDRKIFHSSSFALPLICVGNLSVGGTGKSPMIEYLIRLLKDRYAIATLSRGYKRKTKGYALANEQTTALDIGDEPMQFHVKFPLIPIAVGEQRIEAIPQLLHDRPTTKAILLDDAFQHRSIKAGFNILLTEYNNLFTDDFYLPTGDLRDLKSSARRADVIVITKCDPELKEQNKMEVLKTINPSTAQRIFFTSIEYGKIYHITNQTFHPIDQQTEVLLVTGIANPRPLQLLLEAVSESYHLMQFSDHHIFTIDDLKEIRKRFESMEQPSKLILTTEKDAMRLLKFNTEIADLPLYVVPIKHHFLFNEAEQFNQLVINFIDHFPQVQ